MLRTAFSRKRCSRAILLNTMTELSLLYIFVIRNLVRIFKLLDTLNHFLPFSAIFGRVCERIARVEIVRRKSFFSVNRWRVLFFDNYIAKDKTKIKTNFQYQHTV